MAPGATIGGQAMGTVTANFRPGTMETIELASRPLSGPTGGIDIDNVSIRVTGCAGTVALRVIVRAAVSTSNNDSTVHVYSKAHVL
nr:MspA family porin [Gordonia sp. PP30]